MYASMLKSHTSQGTSGLQPLSRPMPLDSCLPKAQPSCTYTRTMRHCLVILYTHARHTYCRIAPLLYMGACVMCTQRVPQRYGWLAHIGHDVRQGTEVEVTTYQVWVGCRKRMCSHGHGCPMHGGSESGCATRPAEVWMACACRA
jgi:hypothetical protein